MVRGPLESSLITDSTMQGDPDSPGGMEYDRKIGLLWKVNRHLGAVAEGRPRTPG